MCLQWLLLSPNCLWSSLILYPQEGWADSLSGASHGAHVFSSGCTWSVCQEQEKVNQGKTRRNKNHSISGLPSLPALLPRRLCLHVRKPQTPFCSQMNLYQVAWKLKSPFSLSVWCPWWLSGLHWCHSNVARWTWLFSPQSNLSTSI